MNHDDPIDLPEVEVDVIDEAALRALADAVGEHGTGLEVTVKHGATMFAPEQTFGLADSVDALVEGAVLGVQLRYRFGELYWMDTILRTPAGYRVVRMQEPATTRGGVE